MSMSIEEIVVVVFAFLFLVTYGQLHYWKARATTLDERNEDGWANEAKFWRRHFDSEAAEWAEESFTDLPSQTNS
jgi:hypothetical protein